MVIIIKGLLMAHSGGSNCATWNKITAEVKRLLQTHLLLCSPAFIRIAAQVQSAMENDPVELIFKRRCENPGILVHPVHADINIGKQWLPLSGKFESDDIRVSIMAQVFAVDIK